MNIETGEKFYYKGEESNGNVGSRSISYKMAEIIQCLYDPVKEILIMPGGCG